MRIKRVAVAASVVLVAIFAVAAIAAHLLAPRAVALLAESVKASTGRELRFGEVGASLLPRPALELKQVQFGNAAWGSQPWLAQAGRVRIEMDVLELLSRRLHARRIVVEDASVLLETDHAGNGNWVMESPRPQAATAASVDTVELDEVSLQALTLTWRDGSSGHTASARLESLGFAGSSATHRMRLHADASVNGKKLTTSGTAGDLAGLLANVPAYPLDFDNQIGAGSIGVHGTIDRPRAAEEMNLALSAQAPDLSELALLVGVNLPSTGPFRAAAQLTGTPAAPVFKNIDVEIGTPEQAHLIARGEVHGKISDVGGYEWSSNGLDLLVEGSQFGDLSGWVAKPLPPWGRYHIAAHAEGSAAAPALSAIDAALGGDGMPEISVTGVIADARAASGIDLKLKASARAWWNLRSMRDVRLPPFGASARVRDAGTGFRVDDLDLKVAQSSVSATLQIDRSGPRLRVTGKARSPLIDLARDPPKSTGAPATAARRKAPASSDYWKLVDVDLDLEIGRLVTPGGRELQGGSGRIALVDGHVQATALHARFGGAAAQVDGRIADPQNLAGLDLKIALQGKELADLFKYFGKPVPPLGQYDAHAVLHDLQKAPATTADDASAGASAQDGYAVDELELVLGHSSMRGHIAFSPRQPRPLVTATLQGRLIDLSALKAAAPGSAGSNPLLAADVDADLRFERIVLPDRRAIGPVNGGLALANGALQLKQLRVAVDGASATVDGMIADPMKLTGLALTMDVDIRSSAGISTFTGQKSLQQLPALVASGRVTDLPEGYSIAGLKLAAAATTLSGNVTVMRGAERPRLQATLTSPLLDFTSLSHATKPGPTKSKSAAAGARVIPDVPLSLDQLRAIDADLDVRIDALKFGDAASLGPMLLRATIADGRLTAGPIDISNAAGQTLHAWLSADAPQAAWTLRVEGSGVELGKVFARLGQPELVSGGSTELELDVKGRGKSLHAIAGSLNGYVQVKVGPNRVNNVAVDVGNNIVMNMLSAANPFQKTDPDTEVNCIAARLPVKDGVFSSTRDLAIETKKYNLIMSGTVNLGTEKLDLAITPIVTSGLGLGDISTIVSLSGSFADPSIGLTAAGAFKSAASIGTAIALPGLGNLLLKKATSDPHPCATALARE